MRRNKNESQRADQLTVKLRGSQVCHLCHCMTQEESYSPQEKQLSLNAENMQTCQTGPLFYQDFFFSVSVTSWQKSECQVHILHWWRTWSLTITTIMSQRGHVTSRQKYWFIPGLFLSQNLTSIQSQSWEISFQKGFSGKLGNVTWMSTFVQALRDFNKQVVR